MTIIFINLTLFAHFQFKRQQEFLNETGIVDKDNVPKCPA